MRTNMAANAPYYQMRFSQSATETSNTDAMSYQISSENEYHDRPIEATAITDASPRKHDSQPLYIPHSGSQALAAQRVETIGDDHQPNELLEAVSTTEDGSVQVSNAQCTVPARIMAHSRGKRKRTSSPQSSPTAAIARPFEVPNAKSRRAHVPTDPPLQNNDQSPCADTLQSEVLTPSRILPEDAQEAGVHSASVLFRRSSEQTPRKYTRPPMSKVFMSLQLSPENFLQLQAQAKAYMLDKQHPERQNCVGNRGKGDTDMVKLRLFNCVREFLNNGVGEEYFGQHVAKPDERETTQAARALGEVVQSSTKDNLTWPEDGNKIIGLVTPLMRRIITNERQRMYAIETRKGCAKKQIGDSSVGSTMQHAHHLTDDAQALEPLLPFQYNSDPRGVQALRMPSPVVGSGHRDFSTEEIIDGSQAGTSELSDSIDLPMPGRRTTECSLRSINIFLVCPDQAPGPCNAACIKLLERRISAGPSQHSQPLVAYQWIHFIQEVKELLKSANLKYPVLHKRLARRRDRASKPILKTGATCKVNENLRGLAVAAYALQSKEDDNAGSNNTNTSMYPRDTSSSAIDENTQTDSLPPSPARSMIAATQARQDGTSVAEAEIDVAADEQTEDSMLLPHTIKTLGEGGWEILDNAVQWRDLLQQRSHDVWADGIVNVIVELSELPVDVERV